jgi:hypothetical protein
LFLCFELFPVFGSLTGASDPLAWHWWSTAALRGSSVWFLNVGSFPTQVQRYFAGTGNPKTVFETGRGLKGHVNEKDREIFGEKQCFETRIEPAKQAIAFYEAQIQATKDAMRAWT